MKMKTRQTKPMGLSESSTKGKVHSNTSLLQETRKTSNKQPNFTPKATKKGQKNSTVSRRKEIIKIWVEISGKETKETIAKVNKAKS